MADFSGAYDCGQTYEVLGPDGWWAADLVGVRDLTRSLFHGWIQRGLVRARRASAFQKGQGMHRWTVWPDASVVERLQQYRQRDIAGETRRRWTVPHQPSARLREEEPDACRKASNG
jgi:hypothetical protein